MLFRGLISLFLLTLAFLSLSEVPAYAQATRTWVSGVGDDANPCSRTAPCKTFAGAISKTAAGGEINCIDPGGFGAVTITKSITIDCGGTFGSILGAGTNGVTVNGANIVVALKNLSINGAGTGLTGIRFLNGSALHIEDVTVFGFALGLSVEQSAAAAFFVRNSVFRSNSSGGILSKPGAAATVLGSLDGVVMDNNLYGIRVEDRSKVTVSRSVSCRNANNGILAVSASTAAEINVFSTTICNNGNNGISTSGAGALVRIVQSAIFDNGTGLNTGAGGTVSSFTPATNANAGNGVAGAPNGAATPLQ